MSKFISIDAGIIGAIAFFDGKKLIGVEDFIYEKHGKNNVIDAFDLISKIIDFKPEAAIIEQVGFIRGQGGVSSFSFGGRFAEVCMISRLATKNLIFLTPMKWKKSVGLIGSDKKQSAIVAAKVYPALYDSFVQKNNRCKGGIKYFDGRGDAVMIGLSAIKLGEVG
jgi:hypothetical protein